MNPDASTHENNDANTYFTSGKAAMVQMFPFVIKDFEKALGKNLGIARLPQSGPNPRAHRRELVPQLGDPEEREEHGRRLGVHQDGGRQIGERPQLATTVGALPTNKAASGRHQGSDDEVLPARRAAKPQVPLLDSIVPLKVALLYYQQLQAAFSGKTTALQAMQNVRQGPQVAEPLTASHGTHGSEEAPQPAVAVGPPLRGARGRAGGHVFVAYPFGSILYHAFTRWDGIAPAQWVGLHNFRLLWDDPIFRNALEEQRDLRALGADPARPAADRRVRDPPTRAGLAALPRDRSSCPPSTRRS